MPNTQPLEILVPTIEPETILSFGYGNRSWDYTDALLAAYPNIMIIDCRRNPVCTWGPFWWMNNLSARYGKNYWWAGSILGNGDNAKAQASIINNNWLIPRGHDIQETIAHLDGIKQKLDKSGWLPCFMCACMHLHKCHCRFVLPVTQVVWAGWKIQRLWGD